MCGAVISSFVVVSHLFICQVINAPGRQTDFKSAGSIIIPPNAEENETLLIQ